MNRPVVFLSLLILLSCTTQHTQYKTIGSIERDDAALDSIISQNATIEIIAEGFIWSEGPLWIADKKMLLFTDIPNNAIYKWTEEKGKELYLKPSGYTDSVQRGGETGANGLLLNKNDQLVLCQHGDRRMALMDAAIDDPKPVFKTIADRYNGKKFNSPNDAVYRSNGDLFFTDPPYGLEKNVDDPLKEIPFQGVYKVNTAGEVKLLIDSITRPNGIAFLPGETTLIIANSDPQKPYWYKFDLDANDSLINPGIFYDASAAANTEGGNPDGLKVDSKGNVYAAGPGGVWIFNKDAKLLGKIKIPGELANCVLTPDEKTLYITAEKNVLRVKMRD